ncbi:aminoglycoside N(3)-acetyltransferase [Streptomyces sp. NPDC057740]|uniref:aminoglycoside N(3)-acetyltransferase n=1 Tax=Streptomyces sp. NPDC057740 TaxID=3346234 RepID=UPI0036C6341F
MSGGRSLREGLRALGVRPGSVLLAHASLRRVGAAPEAVLAALLDVLGPGGTLVVPAFTAGNSDTSPAYQERIRDMTERQVSDYRAAMPPFEADRTPSQGMGRLAEAVRCHGEAVRSTHPQTSFAAVGARARELMAAHDEECHLGERSPLAPLYRAGAEVLLMGVGYEVCSAFHLAEYRVAEPPHREYSCVVLRGGERCWTSYKDVALDDQDFGALGAAFQADGDTRPEPVVRRGPVGNARARLFPLAGAVDFATGWLARNRPRGLFTEPSQIAAGFLH